MYICVCGAAASDENTNRPEGCLQACFKRTCFPCIVNLKLMQGPGARYIQQLSLQLAGVVLSFAS